MDYFLSYVNICECFIFSFCVLSYFMVSHKLLDIFALSIFNHLKNKYAIWIWLLLCLSVGVCMYVFSFFLNFRQKCLIMNTLLWESVSMYSPSGIRTQYVNHGWFKSQRSPCLCLKHENKRLTHSATWVYIFSMTYSL